MPGRLFTPETLTVGQGRESPFRTSKLVQYEAPQPFRTALKHGKAVLFLTWRLAFRRRASSLRPSRGSARIRMTRQLFATILIAAAVEASALAAPPQPYPPFSEIIELLRTNLVGFAPGEFERRAGEALVREFGAKWTESTDAPTTAASAPIASKTIHDRHFPYVQVGHVDAQLAPALESWLSDTNAFAASRGVIIDLRFATGTDYKAVAQVAALFARPDQPLLDWGDGLQRSSSDTNKNWTLPVAVLINSKTSGAAETLAAVLQEGATGLLIGSRTAGQSGPLREFTLSGGQRLQVPFGLIRLASGDPLPSGGIRPDIEVHTRVEHELAWLNDPFTAIASSTNSSSATNRIVSSISVRRKVNEAELVRAQKSGKNPDSLLNGADSPSPKTEDPNAQAVRDPVLGRALDLLKGLSVIRRR